MHVKRDALPQPNFVRILAQRAIHHSINMGMGTDRPASVINLC
jgi:hypothetical protein